MQDSSRISPFFWFFSFLLQAKIAAKIVISANRSTLIAQVYLNGAQIPLFSEEIRQIGGKCFFSRMLFSVKAHGPKMHRFCIKSCKLSQRGVRFCIEKGVP